MLYGLLSFLGAFVLFFVQPFLGKVLTPRFGGGAQVWITCMLFFQATLLLGYGYAHLLVRRLRPRGQALMHGAVLAAALGAMLYQALRHGNPLMPSAGDLALGGEITPFQVLSTLVRVAALPLVALSATSPLTQAWYGRIFRDRVPYRLYALSNAGSLAGLLAYPFFAERWLSTPAQGWWIFGAMAVFMAGMAALGGKSATASEVDAPRPVETAVSVGRARPWLWLLASASGSVVLMATTNLLATDVATIPLLWVLPLALYLLSFILVFENRWPGGSVWKLVQWLLPLAVCLPLLAYGQKHQLPSLMILACCGVVFFGCLACHGYLYELRPGAEGLTGYYLVMALGGSLGGVAVGLGAPLVMSRLYEFGIGVLLVGLCGLLWVFRSEGGRLRWVGAVPALLCLGLGGWNLRERALEPGFFVRNFFGSVRVTRVGPYIAMNHGRVIHGVIDLERPQTALTYYGPDSGVGRVLDLQAERKPALKVGVVGLGLGTVAAYGRPGDTYCFYEINPAVIDIAGSALGGGSFLQNARAKIEVVEGDARIRLDQELKAQGSRAFDVLLVDAFSADCVPWHLLTEEAFATYLAHLAPGGILVLHVSNALSVDRIAITSAKAHDLYGAYLNAFRIRPQRGGAGPMIMDNRYVVLARKQDTLQSPLILDTAMLGFGPKTYRGLTEGSARLPLLPGGVPWRDGKNSLSDLLGGISFK